MCTLKGTGKFNHIEGEALSPGTPNFRIWDNDDLQIITWLWGSMTTKNNRNYMFYFNAREIWEDLANSYSSDRISLHAELGSKIFGANPSMLQNIMHC